MNRYPSREVARFDQQFAEIPTEKNERLATQRLQRRIRELEAALEPYRHCRHACINCFCTKEARAALNGDGKHG